MRGVIPSLERATNPRTGGRPTRELAGDQPKNWRATEPKNWQPVNRVWCAAAERRGHLFIGTGDHPKNWRAATQGLAGDQPKDWQLVSKHNGSLERATNPRTGGRLTQELAGGQPFYLVGDQPKNWQPGTRGGSTVRRFEQGTLSLGRSSPC